MDNPSRLRSIHTRCTCCHPDHAGESGLDRTHTRVRNLKSRTIHSASRRHGARESGLSHTRIRARNSSNRNVCILSPSQFSFRRVVYQTDSPRAISPPQIGNWQHWNWQHSHIGNTPASPGGASRPRRAAAPSSRVPWPHLKKPSAPRAESVTEHRRKQT